MRTAGLQTSVSVKLDVNGNGTAQAGPGNPGETWLPAVVSVSASSNINEAECRIYTGSGTNQVNYADGTLSGSTGDSTTNAVQTLYPGMYIFAVWSGGDPGATATMVISGTRQVP